MVKEGEHDRAMAGGHFTLFPRYSLRTNDSRPAYCPMPDSLSANTAPHLQLSTEINPLQHITRKLHKRHTQSLPYPHLPISQLILSFIYTEHRQPLRVWQWLQCTHGSSRPRTLLESGTNRPPSSRINPGSLRRQDTPTTPAHSIPPSVHCHIRQN